MLRSELTEPWSTDRVLLRLQPSRHASKRVSLHPWKMLTFSAESNSSSHVSSRGYMVDDLPVMGCGVIGMGEDYA